MVFEGLEMNVKESNWQRVGTELGNVRLRRKRSWVVAARNGCVVRAWQSRATSTNAASGRFKYSALFLKNYHILPVSAL